MTYKIIVLENGIQWRPKTWNNCDYECSLVGSIIVDKFEGPFGPSCNATCNSLEIAWEIKRAQEMMQSHSLHFPYYFESCNATKYERALSET